jgi:hypothetical protein
LIIVPNNWADLQHYKDRSPPWIKLHKKLLDNFEWHSLPVASRALAPMLWLLASEHERGEIDAAPKKLAFRLRMSEREAADAVKSLIDNGFFVVVQGDSAVLAGRKQSAMPETEAEKRKEEAEKKARDFEEFWNAYPKKEAKKDAIAAWDKVDAPIAVLLIAIAAKRRTEDWTKAKGQFVPLPATWLRGRRWEDAGVDVQSGAAPDPDSREAIEAEGIAKGIGPWNEAAEQFPIYKARVRGPKQPGLSLDALAGMAQQRQGVH